ncbi:hypothetical protein phiVC8_p39 [Vibrio phage phiVC8]|uniref:Uncharacterized protein n=1 Tax=Vibrio phage phiVC8 TaxID=1076759 RepID=G3FFP8_BPVC8|nr:hypothetical protein phiVC8_p39 [Vibrio phage phiVC8]AEM62936.1 hypothetical protein phiVC8_p39 [Vibrio phage phiVC8]
MGVDVDTLLKEPIMANKDMRRLVTKTMSHLVAFAMDVKCKYGDKYKVSIEIHPTYNSIWVWASVRSEEPTDDGIDKYVSLDPHVVGGLDWQPISFGENMVAKAEEVMAKIRLRIYQRER